MPEFRVILAQDRCDGSSQIRAVVARDGDDTETSARARPIRAVLRGSDNARLGLVRRGQSGDAVGGLGVRVSEVVRSEGRALAALARAICGAAAWDAKIALETGMVPLSGAARARRVSRHTDTVPDRLRPADPGGGRIAGRADAREDRVGALGRAGDEQAAGGLRIGEQMAAPFGKAGGQRDVGAEARSSCGARRR